MIVGWGLHTRPPGKWKEIRTQIDGEVFEHTKLKSIGFGSFLQFTAQPKFFHRMYPFALEWISSSFVVQTGAVFVTRYLGPSDAEALII